MISLTGEDGTPLWLSPIHVTFVCPISDDVTQITLVCGTAVRVSGDARQIAAALAADMVATPEGALHAVHPLEMD